MQSEPFAVTVDVLRASARASYRQAAGARNHQVQETQAAALRFCLETRLPPAGAA